MTGAKIDGGNTVAGRDPDGNASIFLGEPAGPLAAHLLVSTLKQTKQVKNANRIQKF